MMITAVAVNAGQPKLIVGIVVDGLQEGTLEMLRPQLEAGGFNRFLNDGVVLENIDYGTNLDATAATAVLMTGASANINGISGERKYNPDARRTNHIFDDASAVGNFTNEKLSPAALNVTTLSDEARIAGAGVTYVYALAPNAAQALVLGSHAGNSAVWFDENTGQWASTRYYKDMPSVAVNANRTNTLRNRIDNSQWTPADITQFVVPLQEHLKHYPFTYTFSSKDSDRYARFAGSPLMNDEISEMAREYLRSLELGRHEGTDVLNLAFNLQPYEWSKTAENRYELYDSYIRLDKSLAQLFSAIDSTVGKENAIIYLAGTPPQNQRRRYDEKWNIPAGEFSSRRAVSLLNLYLIAKYGNGEWVTAYNDKNFYLNAELAKKLDKDIYTIRRDAADFLIRMAGVGHSYTIEDVINAEPRVPNAEGKSRNTVVANAGDVMIEIIPGWSLIDDYNLAGAKTRYTYSESPTTGIFMISAPGLTPHRIGNTVDARAIAPALAGMMHIRSPNGAGTPAVSFK